MPLTAFIVGSKTFLSIIIHRYDIQWAKGHQKIKKMSSKRDKRATSINTYVTKRGSLNIRYAEPMDSGLYTCMGNSVFTLKSLNKSTETMGKIRNLSRYTLCLGTIEVNSRVGLRYFYLIGKFWSHFLEICITFKREKSLLCHSKF